MSEATNPNMSAADVEAAIDDHAEAFEMARRKRARDLAAAKDRRDRRTERQFWFLFIVLFLGLSLLAYRTEVNNNAVEQNAHEVEVGFYNACLVRQDRQVQANVGRETIVQLAAANVAPEAKAERVEQLRSALLLPVEDCGPAPTND